MALVMTTYLAGVGFRPGARDRIAQLIPGEKLALVREPDNAHDKNAVAVYDGDMHIGYVPAIHSPAVAKAMGERDDVEATYCGEPATTAITITWGD